MISPYVKSGKARALAVASPKRSVYFPDVPTTTESGYPGVQVSNVGSQSNTISRNSIFGNNRLGININGGTQNGFDVTANETTALSTHVLPTKDQLERPDLTMGDVLSTRLSMPMPRKFTIGLENAGNFGGVVPCGPASRPWLSATAILS